MNAYMNRSLRKALAWIAALLALVLCFYSFPGKAKADGNFENHSQLYFITDEAGLLTEEEKATLEQLAESTSQQYGCGIYVVTVPNYKEFGLADMERFTEWIYDAYTLGLGSGKDAVMLAISMSERDFDIFAHGDFGNYAFTDYGKDLLDKEIIGDLGNANYFSAFQKFISLSGNYLQRAASNDPVDRPVQEPKKPGLMTYLLMFGLIPAVAGGVSAGSQKAKMYSVHFASSAGTYSSDHGLKVHKRVDTYTHTTENRVRKVKEERNTSGGGTTVNSHGSSHHSGKF